MKPDFDVIFILGPQGSGKGTQAEILAHTLGFFYWEMGAILRAQRDTVLSDGSKIGDIIDNAHYLTDPQLIEVLAQNIKSIPKDKGIIFDGVPRRVGQAKFLMDYLRSIGFSRMVTVYIDVVPEESMKRLLLRAQVQGRPDDTPEGITRRLAQAQELTGPVLDYLKGETRVFMIDGHPSIPEVAQQIAQALHL